LIVDPAGLKAEDLTAAGPPLPPPQPTPAVDGDGIPDFSAPARRVRFRIDDDVFEGPRDLPAEHALRFIAKAERWRQLRTDDAVALLPELFEPVLLPESHARFCARLGDQQRPISLVQVPRVVLWLFEQYGMRPTQPSPDSSPGSASPADGTSLTVAPPQPASTPPGSPSPAG
jgi:hypothetical protein